MGSSNNNYTPTVVGQIRYIVQWFQEWGEMQKNDFLPILAQAFGSKSYVNGVLADMDKLSNLEDKPPSLFQCRIKLFKDWSANWNSTEKDQLINELKSIDQEFIQKYDQEVSPSEIAVPSKAPQANNGNSELQSEVQEHVGVV